MNADHNVILQAVNLGRRQKVIEVQVEEAYAALARAIEADRREGTADTAALRFAAFNDVRAETARLGDIQFDIDRLAREFEGEVELVG